MADAPTQASSTVLVTVHDRRQYVPEALASVRSPEVGSGQTQIILVGPRELEDCKDSCPSVSVKFVASEEKGLGGKIADAVPSARGETVFFLEDDDRFLPDKLGPIASQFAEVPELGFYQHAFSLMDSSGHAYGASPSSPERSARSVRPRGVYLAAGPRPNRLRVLDHLPRGMIPGLNLSTIAVRRSLLTRLGPRLREAGLYVDTFLLYSALALDYGVCLDGRVLSERRVHESASHPQWASVEAPDVANQFMDLGKGPLRAMREMVVEARWPELLAELDAKAELNELIRRLRRVGTRRGDLGSPLLKVLAHAGSFEVRSYPGVLPLASLALLSPPIGHRAYLFAKRMGF